MESQSLNQWIKQMRRLSLRNAPSFWTGGDEVYRLLFFYWSDKSTLFLSYLKVLNWYNHQLCVFDAHVCWHSTAHIQSFFYRKCFCLTWHTVAHAYFFEPNRYSFHTYFVFCGNRWLRQCWSGLTKEYSCFTSKTHDSVYAVE